MQSINDNLVAIDMLKDITQIIAGIERAKEEKYS